MSFAPYEFLWVVKESAYGTPKTTPTAGVDSMYIRLAGANRFTPRKRPKRRKVASGAGYAAKGYVVSDQEENVGDLQVELCYSQAKLLLDWAVTRVNVAQTVPWTTTEPSGDLASCSVYHGTMYSDTGAILRKLYSGVKVTGWSLPSSSDTGVTLLKLGLRAKRTAAADPDATAFPAPADTAFPTDAVLFSHSAGAIVVASAALAYCDGVTLSAENALDARYFQTSVLTLDRLRGRSTKAELHVLKSASPNWRTPFEALTSVSLTAAWANGTNTIAINYYAQNVIDTLEDDLTPGKLFDQSMTLEGMWDASASNDVSFTFT